LVGAGIGCSAGAADARQPEEDAGVEKTTADVDASLHGLRSRLRVDYSSGFFTAAAGVVTDSS
jgi:hypothetical protein